MVVEIDACQVCDGDRFKALPRPSTWIGDTVFHPVADDLGLNQCSGCGFVFVNPRPSPDLVTSFYKVDDYDCHDHDTGNELSSRLDPVLDILSAFAPEGRPGRLLDYGCGGGYFVRRARERGWDATGYDIGERARSVCASLGIPFVGDVHALEGKEFDLVTLHHVFEHLYDYPAFFNLLDRIAGRDTLVYIEVPNARSLRARLAAPPLTRRFEIDERYRAYPIHLSYFSLPSLTQLLGRFGYDVVHRYNFGVGLDEYFVERRNGKGRQSSNGHSSSKTESGADGAENRSTVLPRRLVKKLANPLKKVVKQSLWNLELGENIAVVARKTKNAA